MSMGLNLDGNKLMHHLDRVLDWQAGKKIMPLYLSMSPSSRCNHKCSFCVYHNSHSDHDFLSLQDFENTLGDFKKANVKALFFSGSGEPLLNPHCVKMIQLTKKAGIDVALNTNGHLLNPESSEKLVQALSWIRISLNAATPRSYAKIHGTSVSAFDSIIKNVEELVYIRNRLKSDMTIGVQCLLLDENYREIESLATKVKRIGVDYLAIKPYLDHPLHPNQKVSQISNIESVIHELVALTKLSDDKFSFVIREGLFTTNTKRAYKKCLSLPFMGEIDASGDVYTCGAHLGDSRFCYGNIKDTSFLEIWQGAQAERVRKVVENNWDLSNCLPQCRHESVNQFLNLINDIPDHVNFI